MKSLFRSQIWILLIVTLCIVSSANGENYNITQMVTDFERPFVYAIERGQSDDTLLIISVETEQVIKALPIGVGVTDMTIHYGEGRLYVSNWLQDETRVVDLVTQEELPSLELGIGVYKINAGRPGRLYYEGKDQWINFHIINTADGSLVGSLNHVYQGDGEINPSGKYYYHCDHNISNSHIHKYDISTDAPSQVASSLEHPPGSRNLVLSGDGSRLFWRGYIYDADLNELGWLGSEIYTTTLYGDLAFGANEVFNVHTGDVVYTLPSTSDVIAVSGDQEKLFYFDESSLQIVVIPMSEIADVPSPGLNPDPADGTTIILPLDTLFWDISPFALGYNVFFGEDETSVADADTTSVEYLGRVISNQIVFSESLDLSKTYYWRVDQIGYYSTTPGTVWSFIVAPLVVTPNNLDIVTVTNAPDISLSIELTSPGTTEAWEISESIPWLSIEHVSGFTPDSVDVIVSTLGLSEGVYIDSLLVTSGSYQFVVPVRMELIALELTQMVTDFARPYIYGLHRGSGNFDDAYLLFISTETDQIERVIPIGSNPTDMTIHYGEDRLYVSNWHREMTRVVDLVTQEELPSLELGTDVYKINAGRPGRLYYEGEDQWVDVHIINTEDGSQVGNIYSVRAGDGEVDPTGNYYYHCDHNSSNARLHKYDISTDLPFHIVTSLAHPYGSRNLVISGDGSRLFWRGYIYDADLNELGGLGSEIYATTLHGDLAFGANEVFNVHSGDVVYTLPSISYVSTISADQEKLFYFDKNSHQIVVIPMSEIADIPGPGLNPNPADGATVILPLDTLFWDISPLALRYDVYFGDDETSVANADTTSSEYLGNVISNKITFSELLELGETYYWRVDQIGFSGTTPGTVWSFTVAPIVVTPNNLNIVTVTNASEISMSIELTSPGLTELWGISESIPWLSIDHVSGFTPDSVDVTVSALGLSEGVYMDSIMVTSGSYQFVVPVRLELITLELTQMVTDYERPYIYGLHRGSGNFDDAFLLFISTETDQIERVIPIGSNPTDMTIHYGEDRLYVSNWLREQTRVVDLITQEELPSLELGTDVNMINAGRPGRLYYEGSYHIYVINTADGSQVGSEHVGVGDGEVDPTGNFYYHCDVNSSNARIHKYDISTDTLSHLKESSKHPFGSRNLILSRDGSRLFWRGYVYDADLNELDGLSNEIYTTTLHGDLAFSSTEVFNIHTGDVIYTLPVMTNVLTVSGDQEKLFLFDESSNEIVVTPMSRIAGIHSSALNPIPANEETVVLPMDTLFWDINPLAFRYDIYFSDDETKISDPKMNSELFFGSVIENHIALSKKLELGETYYWRVDQVGFSGTTPGAVWSFTVAPIEVTPNELKVVTVTNAPYINSSIKLESPGTTKAWEISESISWLRLDHYTGNTPYSLEVYVSAEGLSEGVYNDSLLVTSGNYQFVIPVQLDLFTLEMTQLVTDYVRPYVYGLHRGNGNSDDALLLFISTETDQIERVIPIGSNPTDMTINYGEDRLYVSNWLHEQTRVVDLVTQQELPSLELGTDVYKINAGRPGRLYYEGNNHIYVINTADGSQVSYINFIPEGDGEIDPTSNYYYHCDNNSSRARIYKYDISTDILNQVMSSFEYPYGSRNLVMSGDGSRLFWQGHVFDANLNELGGLGSEVYATTLHGDLAFGANEVFNAYTGDLIYTLPTSSDVIAVSGDQEKLFLFNESSHQIVVIPMSEIADVPGPVLNPIPADGATVILPIETLLWDINPLALHYDVYIGDDEMSVADADTTSGEYLGRVTSNQIAFSESLELGKTYYWRVDQIGFSSTTPGTVWSFTVAPIVVTPNNLNVVTVTNAPDISLNIELTSPGTTEAWEISESIPWLSIDLASGFTPDSVDVIVSTLGLSGGVYIDSLMVTSGGYQFVVPVRMELITLELTQMVTDYERPYIYGLHRGSGNFDDAYLLFISTETDQIERVILIGSNPTDMTIHYGEDRLYVSNWHREETRVVDLVAQEELPSLELGTDVYKINAGRPGRIYYEEENQWISIRIINTADGSQVGAIDFAREGDGEVDPTGNFYYHCGNNSSSARIHKYDISTDTFSPVGVSAKHPFGSRNLILSRDGSRLFWRGYVYDADLIELSGLGSEIYATTLHGDFAFSSTEVFNVNTGDVIYPLPVTTNILTLSGDQEKLFLFDKGLSEINVIPMSSITKATIIAHRTGDSDGNGSIDITDVVFLINFIFSGGTAPEPLIVGDADCSGTIDISDAVYLISYIFSNGPVPCEVIPYGTQNSNSEIKSKR